MSMLWFLRLLFITVLGSMLWVTSWASLQVSILAIPRDVFTHPWFIATLFDAYFGFLTFYVWQAWKEQSLAARVLWFIDVMLLGNLAMAIYLLVELFRIKESSQISEVITRRNPGRLLLPSALVVASIGIYLLA
ncbi:MAG: DUF1475 family protein [Verrucomicrobia bacterium]|nr:DUF1475 family protein [Verrucomicrobiota bacterium]